MSTSTSGQEAPVVNQASPGPFILVSMLMFLGALFLFISYLIGILWFLFNGWLTSFFLFRFSNRFQKRQKNVSETTGPRSWLRVTRGDSWLKSGGHSEWRNSRSGRSWGRCELWSCPLCRGRRLSSSVFRGGLEWGRLPIQWGRGDLRLKRGRSWSDHGNTQFLFCHWSYGCKF